MSRQILTFPQVTDITPYLPWWLECNPDRFPYWWGRPDPRHQDLLAALQHPQLFLQQHEEFHS